MSTEDSDLDTLEKMVRADGRYARDAYIFVSEALRFSVERLGERRHVSGQELLTGTGLAMKVRNYPQGTEVQIHHDPRNPEVAVLKSGVSSSSYLVLAAGVLVTMIGVLVSLLGVKGDP